MPPASTTAQLVAQIFITVNRAFAHFSSSVNTLVICCCSSASRRRGWCDLGATVLIDNSCNVACTSNSLWVCCPNEATNVTSNILIMHSVACCHSSNQMLLDIILSGPLELLCQLLLACPLQQGLCLQGCLEQPRPQLPLQLMPRPEAASSYASEDCMQCDISRGDETHMVKSLTCKRHKAVVLPWALCKGFSMSASTLGVFGD